MAKVGTIRGPMGGGAMFYGKDEPALLVLIKRTGNARSNAGLAAMARPIVLPCGARFLGLEKDPIPSNPAAGQFHNGTV